MSLITNRQWLSARGILVAKNYDVNTINITILNEIPGDTTTYQSIETVMNQDDFCNFVVDLGKLPNSLVFAVILQKCIGNQPN
ncbi:ATP-dependent DNA helicase [Aphis craccivora]|uniref:ATP-dependent DNA helicase n=1 Tax=Aphis craccivora TaxID=307492 RepID=A0A6G0YEI6_APHCR|nr:ATP-dependent DNA helicase [Aphis craccivora]